MRVQKIYKLTPNEINQAVIEFLKKKGFEIKSDQLCWDIQRGDDGRDFGTTATRDRVKEVTFTLEEGV